MIEEEKGIPRERERERERERFFSVKVQTCVNWQQKCFSIPFINSLDPRPHLPKLTPSQIKLSIQMTYSTSVPVPFSARIRGSGSLCEHLPNLVSDMVSI